MQETLSDRFDRDGYVIIPAVVDRSEIPGLREFFLSEMEGREGFETGVGSLVRPSCCHATIGLCITV